MAETNDNASIASQGNQTPGEGFDNAEQNLRRPHEPHSRTQRGSRMIHPRLNTNASRVEEPQYESPQSHNPPRRPQFSLAGSHAPAHAPSFVDPSYYRLNPEYNQPIDKPVWGLAKPLPRVVRKGRRDQGRAGSVQQVPPGRAPTAVSQQGQQGSESIPQVARIASQRSEAYDATNHQSEVLAHQGRQLNKLREKERTHSGLSLEREENKVGGTGRASGWGIRANGSETSVERYGSPRNERADPLETYILSHSDSQISEDFGIHRHKSSIQNAHRPNRQATAHLEGADVGGHRLSDVAEVDTTSIHSAETIKTSWDADLEAGKDLVTPGSTESHKAEDEQGEFDAAFEYGEEEGYHNWWTPIRERFREPLAEGLATFVMALIAISTNLSIITSQQKAGDYQSGNWAGGFGVMLGIYIAGGISGGHLNPAISILLCVFRGFPPRKTLIYICSQCLGSFLAALICFGIYRNAILELDNGVLNAGHDNSGRAFITGLQTWTSPAEGWASEFVATGILACAILALGDDMNAPPGAGMHAFIVGLVVTVLGMAFGYPTGPCLNPARDLGPRLAALILGYGGKLFTMDYAWWIWGAWLSTISGALVGSFCYDAFVFMGGESPVNYLGRKKPPMRRKAKFQNWWKHGSARSKMGEV